MKQSQPHLTQLLGTRKVPACRGVHTIGDVLWASVIVDGKRQLVPLAEHLASAGLPVRVR